MPASIYTHNSTNQAIMKYSGSHPINELYHPPIAAKLTSAIDTTKLVNCISTEYIPMDVANIILPIAMTTKPFRKHAP
jgi:hypothetical protein